MWSSYIWQMSNIARLPGGRSSACLYTLFVAGCRFPFALSEWQRSHGAQQNTNINESGLISDLWYPIIGTIFHSWDKNPLLSVWGQHICTGRIKISIFLEVFCYPNGRCVDEKCNFICSTIFKFSRSILFLEKATFHGYAYFRCTGIQPFTFKTIITLNGWLERF